MGCYLIPACTRTPWSDQDIYANLPEIVGAALTGNLSGVPCEDQLVCAIEGASPALQTCLKTVLGVDSYQAIESGKRSSTPGELKLAQPCLDQYGTGQAASPQTAGSGNGMPAYMQNLSAGSWQAILTIFLPPDALKSMADSTLDQFFAYLNGGTDTVSVPLGQLKERLLGPSGCRLVRAGTELPTALHPGRAGSIGFRIEPAGQYFCASLLKRLSPPWN